MGFDLTLLMGGLKYDYEREGVFNNPSIFKLINVFEEPVKQGYNQGAIAGF